MAETWKTRLRRWQINWFPAYRRTGARIVSLANDFTEMRMLLPLNRSTRNVNGTIYGGCIYSAVDPLHALLVALLLGPGYQVWVKAARITFRRQGRTALHATARITRDDLAQLRAALRAEGRAERDFAFDIVDDSGETCAHCVITVHVRSQNPAPRQSERRPQDANHPQR